MTDFPKDIPMPLGSLRQAMGNAQVIQTPQGGLAVIRTVAERLLKDGVITGALDGELRAGDAATVKAALMAAAVCDFCSTPGAVHLYDVPDFGITSDNPSNYAETRSTGGWAACETCKDLIDRGQKKALLDRAMASFAFPKFTRRALEELQNKFWEGMEQKASAAGMAAGIADYIHGELPKILNLPAHPPQLGTHEARFQSALKLTGLSPVELKAILDGKIDRHLITRLAQLEKTYRGELARGDAQTTARVVHQLLKGERPPLPNIVPHWQAALDARFNALGHVSKATSAQRREFFSPDAVDLHDPAAVRRAVEQASKLARIEELDFQMDVKHLQAAETFSFNEETCAAIMEATASIPREAPLSSVEIPTGAGWFWFATPLSIQTTTKAIETTAALLWGWEQGPDREVAMRFSAYVQTSKGNVMPSTRWYWELNQSFDEMLAAARASHRKHYGPGGKFVGERDILGEDKTIEAISQLSLFFLASCMWFKQKILVPAAGHIERHARKRYVREHKLSEAPTVRVIALRASVRQPSSEPSEPTGEGTVRKLKHRFTVAGHARLQVCGPGRKDRKLIWVAPFLKGPEGAPFKQRTKVYAVIR